MEKKEFVTKWRKMLKLQQKLDVRILKESGQTYKNLLDNDGYICAITDELGELNHELKANWCWWKKTQKPVNRDRVLEEFVDILHFVLSWQIAFKEIRRYGLNYTPWAEAWHEYSEDYTMSYPASLKSLEYDLADPAAPPTMSLMALMKSIGLAFEEVYEAYLKKNAVNHKRQDEGY